MWLSHYFAFDIHELFLKFLFYFCKIFGVAPMTVDYAKNRPCYMLLMYSKFGILYNLFLVFLTIFAFYPCFRLSYFDLTERTNFEKFVNSIHLIFFMFTTLIVLIVFCIRQERAVTLANKLYAIYRLNNNVKSSMILSSIKRIVTVNFMTTSLWLATISSHSTYLLIYFVVVSFYNFITNSLFLQYSVILKLLHHLYRSLNTDLRSLLDSPFIMLEMDRHSDNEMKLTSARLKRLREIHMLLCHFSRDVADFYSLPAFFCIANSFFVLIIYSFYVFRGFVPLVTVHCVMLMILIVVSLMILLRAASVTVAESKVTGEIVSEAMVSCSNQVIGRQLEVFSIYCLHKNVKFGVFNLYSLDESLLISIVGVITTYLVILLQFKESNSSQK